MRATPRTFLITDFYNDKTLCLRVSVLAPASNPSGHCAPCPPGLARSPERVTSVGKGMDFVCACSVVLSTRASPLVSRTLPPPAPRDCRASVLYKRSLVVRLCCGVCVCTLRYVKRIPFELPLWVLRAWWVPGAPVPRVPPAGGGGRCPIAVTRAGSRLAVPLERSPRHPLSLRSDITRSPALRT